MNKAKKLENLFNINKTTEKIPLNHSLIFNTDKYLKESRLNRIRLSKEKNLLPLFEEIKSINFSIKSIYHKNHNKSNSLSLLNMTNLNKDKVTNGREDYN